MYTESGILRILPPKMKYLFLLYAFCLALLLTPPPLQAQPGGQIANRTTDWLHFDAARGAYVPFLPDVQGAQPVLHLRLDTENSKGYDLLIRLDSGTAVFEDSDLRYIVSQEGYFRLPFQATNRVRLLSIWHRGAHWEKPPPSYTVRSGASLPKDRRSPGIRKKESDTETPQRPVWVPDAVILLTWGMFVLLVGLRQGETSIFSAGNFRESLGALYKPLVDGQRLGTISGLSFFLYYTTTLGYFLTVWQADFSSFFAAFTDHTLQVAFYTALRLAGLIGFARLYFAHSEIGFLHIRELIRLSLPMASVLFVTSVLLGLGQGGFSQWIPTEVVRWQLLFFLLLRTFLLCYQIFRLRKTVNFYLFSYLCSTEIIPAFFVMQYILNL